MSHSKNNRLTMFEPAWDEPDALVLGQTAMCKHCHGLIVVVDINADDESCVFTELVWKHLFAYFACGKPGSYPQAEPFIGECMLIDDEEAYL